jgi:hypothetical protein
LNRLQTHICVMRRLPLLAFLTLAACSSHEDPLTDAARAGQEAEVRALLARGADANAPVGRNGWPPVIHAIHTNQLRTASALIDGGADVNCADSNGMTALMMAAGYGNDAMVALLLSRGADPKLADRAGRRALDYALTGVADIDKFTLFSCQDSTVELLVKMSPAVKSHSASRTAARMKGCKSA